LVIYISNSIWLGLLVLLFVQHVKTWRHSPLPYIWFDGVRPDSNPNFTSCKSLPTLWFSFDLKHKVEALDLPKTNLLSLIAT
jgi:hypothetical protein